MVKITEIADGINNGILKNIDLVENNSELNSNSSSKLEIVLRNSDSDSYFIYKSNNKLNDTHSVPWTGKQPSKRVPISTKNNTDNLPLILKECKFNTLELDSDNAMCLLLK